MQHRFQWWTALHTGYENPQDASSMNAVLTVYTRTEGARQVLNKCLLPHTFAPPSLYKCFSFFSVISGFNMVRRPRQYLFGSKLRRKHLPPTRTEASSTLSGVVCRQSLSAHGCPSIQMFPLEANYRRCCAGYG
jgi:hypothetical protein